MLDMILRWFREGAVRPVAAVPAVPSSKPRARVEFFVFYEYLDKRYADLVVLTFEQIEDLLGSTLPSPARTEVAWWTDINPATDRYTVAWRQAGRTAHPNLMARHVVFERIPDHRAH